MYAPRGMSMTRIMAFHPNMVWPQPEHKAMGCYIRVQPDGRVVNTRDITFGGPYIRPTGILKDWTLNCVVRLKAWKHAPTDPS